MKTYTLVIETPAGSNTKYNYDPDSGSFKIKKSLPLGMVFPYSFGFIKGTKGDDGDPVDAMIISAEANFPGIHLQAKLIGALLAQQMEKGKKIRNDRYFFVPDDDLIFAHIKDIRDFGKTHTKQLQEFFITYNKLEGKIFHPLRIVNTTSAASLLKNIIQPL